MGEGGEGGVGRGPEERGKDDAVLDEGKCVDRENKHDWLRRSKWQQKRKKKEFGKRCGPRTRQAWCVGALFPSYGSHGRRGGPPSLVHTSRAGRYDPV